MYIWLNLFFVKHWFCVSYRSSYMQQIGLFCRSQSRQTLTALSILSIPYVPSTRNECINNNNDNNMHWIKNKYAWYEWMKNYIKNKWSWKCMYTKPLPIATFLILTLCPCYMNKRMQSLSQTTSIEPYSH